MLVRCCVCERVKADDRWVHGSDSEDPMVTHTYCPKCHQQVKLEIDQWVQKMAGRGRSLGPSR